MGSALTLELEISRSWVCKVVETWWYEGVNSLASRVSIVLLLFSSRQISVKYRNFQHVEVPKLPSPKSIPHVSPGWKNDCGEGKVSTKNVVSGPNFETKAGGSNDFGVKKKLVPKKSGEKRSKDFTKQMFELGFFLKYLKDLKITSTSSHRASAWHSQNRSPGSKKS